MAGQPSSLSARSSERVRRDARREALGVDDGIRADHDAYDGLRLDPLPVRRDAYRGQMLRPLGERVHELPLRRCPGCQSRSARPIGYGPGTQLGERRLVYACPVCRRRHYPDVD